MNQEELFNQEPIRESVSLPEGQIDKLEPFESVEPNNSLVAKTPEQYMEQAKSGLIILDTGRKYEPPFPQAVKDMAQYYSNSLLVEKKQRAFVGIDNGVSGSIGVIYEDGTYEFFKTPVLKAQDYTKAKKMVSRVQPIELKKILSKVGLGSMVMIERPMINSTRFNASMSAIRAFEATITILETLGLAYQIEDSKAWQKALLPIGVTGDDLKTASKDIGNRLFPLTKEVKHPDCDGMLIAQYCKSKFR